MKAFGYKAILSIGILIILSGKIDKIFAQQIFYEDSVYIFKMKDGKVFQGLVKVRETDYLYEVHTVEGMLLLLKEDIKKIYLPSDLQPPGNSRSDSMHYNRYLFTSAGNNVKKGEFYYQNFFIAGSQFIYGVSDRFSIGFGLMPLFDFEGSGLFGYSVSSKLSFDYPNRQGRFNVMAGVFRSFGLQPTYGVIQISNTFGSPKNHITVGLLAFNTNEYTIYNNIRISLSGFLLINKRWALITDNMISVKDQNGFSSKLNGKDYFVSLGARYMKRRFSLTFGACLGFESSDYSEYYLLPWLSSGISLNKRKKGK